MGGVDTISRKVLLVAPQGNSVSQSGTATTAQISQKLKNGTLITIHVRTENVRNQYFKKTSSDSLHLRDKYQKQLQQLAQLHTHRHASNAT
jgi:hypothetical protein